MKNDKGMKLYFLKKLSNVPSKHEFYQRMKNEIFDSDGYFSTTFGFSYFWCFGNSSY